MGTRKKSESTRFLVFRMEAKAGLEPRPMYLTGKNTWTPRRALARKEGFATMKALVTKLKKEFPDLILEECRE